MPIEVPCGEYCWEHSHGKFEICGHLDTEGGHPSCSLGFWEQSQEDDGIKKDPKCASLKDNQSEQVLNAFNLLDNACDSGNAIEIGKAQIKARGMISRMRE